MSATSSFFDIFVGNSYIYFFYMEFIVEIRTCIVVREADDIKSGQGN